MLSKICFCILIFFQGAWSFAIDSTSMTKREFSRNTKSADIETNLPINGDESLFKAMGNLRRGFTSYSAPVVNFGFNTYPNSFPSSIKTANGATSEVMKTNDGMPYLLAGAGRAVGGGEELASSIIGGEKKVIGSGLGVFGTLFDAAVQLGLNIPNQMSDATTLSNSVTTDMTNGMLMGIGDGLTTAGSGVNILANSKSNMINTVGNAIIQNIINAKRIFASIIKLLLHKLKFGLMHLNSGFQTNYNNVIDLFKNSGITKPVENNDDSSSVTDDVTTVPSVTTTEGSADSALLAAADITSDLAALDTNPSGSNNSELEDSGSNDESSAGTNPEDKNDTELSDALAETKPEETDHPALSDDVTTESAATTTEGSADPALLAAADITSALAALDTNPSNNPELKDSASNNESSSGTNPEDKNDTKPSDALAETIPEEPNQPASSDDLTTEAEATATVGAANPALLAAADITSALAALDTNPSETNDSELENLASDIPLAGATQENKNDAGPSADESSSSSLTETKPDETSDLVLPDDIIPEPLAATESSANPVLLGAADITSALAALDTNPPELNNPESEDSAINDSTLSETNPAETGDAESTVTDGLTSVLTGTAPERPVHPALLAAASITSALAETDPLYSSS